MQGRWNAVLRGVGEGGWWGTAAQPALAGEGWETEAHPD